MRTLITVSTATAMLLSGCVTPTTPILGSNVTFGNVETEAIKICSYVPTAAEVASLTGQAAFTTATALAQAMCNALQARAVRRGAVRGLGIRLNGVLLQGHFVNQ